MSVLKRPVTLLSITQPGKLGRAPAHVLPYNVSIDGCAIDPPHTAKDDRRGDTHTHTNQEMASAFSTERAAPSSHSAVHMGGDHHADDLPNYGCLGNLWPTKADARDAQEVWRLGELQAVEKSSMAPACE